MMWLPLQLLFILGLASSITVEEELWMGKEEIPNLGPQDQSTRYKAGDPGGEWTAEEVEITRRRIRMMITPDWSVKRAMGLAKSVLGKNNDNTTPPTENLLMRLAFHDCIPYQGGKISGGKGASADGCDGCLNWKGMDWERMKSDAEEKRFTYPAANFTTTSNQGLGRTAQFLELIYTTIDWPLQTPNLQVSLEQSGKSRSDLWQLAGLVALEQAVERANRACDLDFHARQQVTLLEGRDKCEMKLTKPLKFRTGRRDCKTEEDRKYVTQEHELHPNPWGDGRHLVDYGREAFRMDPEHWMALQAIHGATHGVGMNIKYTWFGPGYISNVYFKRLANKPTYLVGTGGGDLSFLSCDVDAIFDGTGKAAVRNIAIGDQNGKPVAQTGWRTSCFYLFNTTEGGPCLMRPMPPNSWDAPNPKELTNPQCIEDWRAGGLDGWDGKAWTGECRINKGTRACKKAYCGETKDGYRVLRDAGQIKQGAKVEGAWADHQDNKRERAARHAQSWNNEFAFAWEVGMFWNLTDIDAATGRPTPGHRPMGCPGLDAPYESWPYRTNKKPTYASPAMECGVNNYAPEGRALHEIVDDLASDNEHFAEKFFEGWDLMTSNGYSEDELVDGPENGWFGYNSLAEQDVNIDDFETYIANNSPVWFTSPKADPWICGHRGHVGTTCGIRFSKYFELQSRSSSPCEFKNCKFGSDCPENGGTN